MKTVTIHQPQYLPWVPYFDKILQADVFVYLDTVQFEKNGVQNRNQIKTQQGAHWLTLPVRHQFGKSIQDTVISDLAVCGKHLKTIEMAYRRSPHYAEILPLLEPTLANPTDRLSGLCCDITTRILRWLGFTGTIVKSSELSASGKGSDLVLAICKELGATRYLSGQGGKNYMRLGEFSNAGIQVLFQSYSNQEYPQCHAQLGFIKDLSIIDLMFNAGIVTKQVIEKGRRQWESMN